jgi:hypothetical protein
MQFLIVLTILTNLVVIVNGTIQIGKHITDLILRRRHLKRSLTPKGKS